MFSTEAVAAVVAITTGLMLIVSAVAFVAELVRTRKRRTRRAT